MRSISTMIPKGVQRWFQAAIGVGALVAVAGCSDIGSGLLVSTPEAEGQWLEGYRTFNGEIEHIRCQLVGDECVYGGDLMVYPEDLHATEEEAIQAEQALEQEEVVDATQTRSKAAVTVTGRRQLWPRGEIPYIINSNVPSGLRTNIMRAMQHWHDRTVIRFKKKKRLLPRHYVEFIAGGLSDGYVGGRAYRGRRTGCFRLRCGQTIRLRKTTPVGTIIHEIGHAVGLYHEQCHPYREQYINVHYENIHPDYTDAFKQRPKTKRGGLFGLQKKKVKHRPFDFSSIMLYNSFQGSIDPGSRERPTMTKLDGTPFGTQRYVLSPLDAQGVAELYGKKQESNISYCTKDCTNPAEYCDHYTSLCLPKKNIGAECQRDFQCESGFCKNTRCY